MNEEPLETDHDPGQDPLVDPDLSSALLPFLGYKCNRSATVDRWSGPWLFCLMPYCSVGDVWSTIGRAFCTHEAISKASLSPGSPLQLRRRNMYFHDWLIQAEGVNFKPERQNSFQIVATKPAPYSHLLLFKSKALKYAVSTAKLDATVAILCVWAQGTAMNIFYLFIAFLSHPSYKNLGVIYMRLSPPHLSG